jgi:hypothetical protein
MSTSTEISPSVERLLEVSLSRRGQRLLEREQLVHAVFAVLFGIAATALALLAPAARDLDPGLAGALVLVYALVSRAEFPSGAGYALPTQVVFVPMLLLLPTPTVPLLIAVALVLRSCLPGGPTRPTAERVLLCAGDASYALAPALVLVLGGAQTPDWDHWPVYLAALAAQLGVETGLSMVRASLSIGVSPRDILGDMREAHRVDRLLAPVGLLAAFAAEGQPYAVLLLLPLVRLFTISRASAPRAWNRRWSCPARTAAPRCCSAT